MRGKFVGKIVSARERKTAQNSLFLRRQSYQNFNEEKKNFSYKSPLNEKGKKGKKLSENSSKKEDWNIA